MHGFVTACEHYSYDIGVVEIEALIICEIVGDWRESSRVWIRYIGENLSLNV